VPHKITVTIPPMDTFTFTFARAPSAMADTQNCLSTVIGAHTYRPVLVLAVPSSLGLSARSSVLLPYLHGLSAVPLCPRRVVTAPTVRRAYNREHRRNSPIQVRNPLFGSAFLHCLIYGVDSENPAVVRISGQQILPPRAHP